MVDNKPNFLWPTNVNSVSVREFWEGLRRRQLLARKCHHCNEVFFPPRSHCPCCLGDDLGWVKLSGRGTLCSWTKVDIAGPEFDTPFLLGLVDLSEGVGRITSKIIEVEAYKVRIGMPVKIVYIDVHKELTMYCFTIE